MDFLLFVSTYGCFIDNTCGFIVKDEYCASMVKKDGRRIRSYNLLKNIHQTFKNIDMKQLMKKSNQKKYFKNKELASKVVIDCKKTTANKFRTSLPFTQYHINLQNFHSQGLTGSGFMMVSPSAPLPLHPVLFSVKKAQTG